MYTSKLGFALSCVALAMLPATASAQSKFGFGKPASEREIAGWNIDVTPDGRGLPRGSGSVAQGQQVYTEKCIACHGVKGQGKPNDQLVGGQGTLKTDKPIKTIGSFWPYAPSVYDYIYRAMPYTAPQSLTPSEVYAVTAYLLHLNGIVAADAVLDAASLPKIRMPNRDGFTPDPRPDVAGMPCRADCK